MGESPPGEVAEQVRIFRLMADGSADMVSARQNRDFTGLLDNDVGGWMMYPERSGYYHQFGKPLCRTVNEIADARDSIVRVNRLGAGKRYLGTVVCEGEAITIPVKPAEQGAASPLTMFMQSSGIRDEKKAVSQFLLRNTLRVGQKKATLSAPLEEDKITDQQQSCLISYTSLRASLAGQSAYVANATSARGDRFHSALWGLSPL